MEEQIRKIMDNELMGNCDDSQRCAEKIMAHMMEFMTWFLKGLHTFGMVEHTDELLFVMFEEGSEHKYTLDGIYHYWLTNIKKQS